MKNMNFKEFLSEILSFKSKELDVTTFTIIVGYPCVEIKHALLHNSIIISETDSDFCISETGLLSYKKNSNQPNATEQFYILFNGENLIDEYWKDCLKHRMEEEHEVKRLLQILKANLFDNPDKKTLIDMYLDKRPYGNKNIEESVIYNLGWDHKWIMRHSKTPQWVINEAAKIHSLVKNEIIGQ